MHPFRTRRAAISQGGQGYNSNLNSRKDLGHFRIQEHFLFGCIAPLF
jgi:hypothetical protein